MLLGWILFFTTVGLAASLPEVIRIGTFYQNLCVAGNKGTDKKWHLISIFLSGGLFHPADDNQEIAFRYAVEKINADRSILPRSRLSAQIEKISPQDSFHASKRVCHLLRSGVAAIFGPQSAQTASHVQSICDTMEIPHLETRWDFRLRRESCLVNLYPHPASLSKVRLFL